MDEIQKQNHLSELNLTNIEAQSRTWAEKFLCIEKIFLVKTRSTFNDRINYFIMIKIQPPIGFTKKELIPMLTGHPVGVRILGDIEEINEREDDIFEGSLNSKLSFFKNPNIDFKGSWSSPVFDIEDPFYLDVLEFNGHEVIATHLLFDRTFEEGPSIADIEKFVRGANRLGYINKERLAHVLAYDEQYSSESLAELWSSDVLDINGGLTPKGENTKERAVAWYYILECITADIDARGKRLSILQVMHLDNYLYDTIERNYRKADPYEFGDFIKIEDLKLYFPEVLYLPAPEKLFRTAGWTSSISSPSKESQLANLEEERSLLMRKYTRIAIDFCEKTERNNGQPPSKNNVVEYLEKQLRKNKEKLGPFSIMSDGKFRAIWQDIPKEYKRKRGVKNKKFRSK